MNRKIKRRFFLASFLVSTAIIVFDCWMSYTFITTVFQFLEDIKEQNEVIINQLKARK